MPRSRGSFQGRTTARRRRGWSAGPGGTAGVTQSGSGAVFLGAVANLLSDGHTLARLRGRFAAFLPVASAAGDGFQGAFAIGIATQSATAAGIGSVPTPITEQEWDGWLYHQYFGIHAGDRTAGDSNWVSASIDIEVDSKAMRKLSENSSIYAALEVVEVGTAEIDSFFDSRILLLLP